MAHSSAHNLHEPRYQTRAPFYSVRSLFILHFPLDPTTCQGGPLGFVDREGRPKIPALNSSRKTPTVSSKFLATPKMAHLQVIFQRLSTESLEDKADNRVYNSRVQPPSPNITSPSVYVFIKVVGSLSRQARHPLISCPTASIFQKTEEEEARLLVSIESLRQRRRWALFSSTDCSLA